VVVPACDRMPLETLEHLLAAAAGGVTVIFEQKPPDDVPGWADLAHRRQQFQSLLDGLPPRSADGTLAALAEGRIALGGLGALEPGLDSAGVRRESLVDHPGLRFVRRAADGGRYYFIANRGNQPLDGWITLAAAARAIALMDPMTGEVGLAQSKPAADGDTQVYLQLDPGESIILRTFATPEPGPAWAYRHAAGAPVELSGTWDVKFIAGGPALPAPYQTAKLGSWTGPGGPAAQSFAGTAVYTLTFPAPGGRPGPWLLSLGQVCQSARVRLNGKPLGTLFIPPFSVPVETLLPQGNVLEVEVTNVSANRVRDLDIRHVAWKIFDPPNLLNVNYKPFDASGWPLTDSGLLGPVTLTPEKAGD
jgi:hypothetical protein